MPQIALTQEAPLRSQTRWTKRERLRPTKMAEGRNEVSAPSQANSASSRSWSEWADTVFLAVLTLVLTYAWIWMVWWIGATVLRWIW